MKKSLPIALIALALIATPAFAVSDKANEKAQNNNQSHIHAIEPTNIPMPTVVVTEDPLPTITVTPTTVPTSTPSAEKKVLGKQIKDLEVVVPTGTPTCSPDATYKNHGEYVSCVAHEHPGGKVVADAARSDIGKKHAEVTPPISSPITSAIASAQTGFNPLKSLGSLVNRFFGFFKHLI